MTSSPTSATACSRWRSRPEGGGGVREAGWGTWTPRRGSKPLHFRPWWPAPQRECVPVLCPSASVPRDPTSSGPRRSAAPAACDYHRTEATMAARWLTIRFDLCLCLDKG